MLSPTPPFDFGAAFTRSSHLNERAGTETEIWIAPQTPLSAKAARLFERELARAGFRPGAYVRLPGATGLALHCVWWPSDCRATAAELADLAQRVAAIPEEEERARARQAAAVAEANAARAARGRTEVPRLAEIVERSPWQLGRLASEAARILENELTDSLASRVVALLETADRAVTSAEARLRRGAPRDFRLSRRIRTSGRRRWRAASICPASTPTGR